MSNKGFAFVLIGSIFECGWVYGLKHSSSNLEYAITIALICASFYSFMSAFKYLLASVAYVLFVGFGTFFVVIAEMISDYLNGISLNFLRIFFIITLLIGVLGLKGVKN